jgi:hypothetical protein
VLVRPDIDNNSKHLGFDLADNIKGKRLILIQLSLFIFLGFGLYFKSLQNPFVLDDEEQIVFNPMVHSVENIASFFAGSTMNSGNIDAAAGIYYKPLMSVAYSVLWDFFGSEPLPFHVLQLSLHIINSLLVFFLFCYFISRPVSLGFALLFLVHPMNSENVLYCANLQDVLYLFFGLSATLANLVVLNAKTHFSARKKLRYNVFSGCCILLSLLSKESGLLFVLANFYILSLNGNQQKIGNQEKKIINQVKIKKRFLKYVYLLVPVLIYLYLRVGVAHLTSITPPIVKIGQADFWTRVITLPKVLMYYFSLIIFPAPVTLVQDWIVSEMNWSDFYLPLSLVGLLIFIFYRFWQLLYRAKNKANDVQRQGASLFIFMLILGLGLHSQLVPLDGTVATRWFYFPMIGLFGILAVLLDHLILKFDFLQTRQSQNILLAIFAIKILGLSAMSYARSQEWKSALELYSIEAERQPDLYFIQNNLGVELYRKGEFMRAHGHFEKATQLAPSWSVSWNNLGSSWQAKGDLDTAENCYWRAINLSSYYMAYENYALLLYKRKKFEELKTFLDTKALKVFEGNPILVELRRQLN